LPDGCGYYSRKDSRSSSFINKQKEKLKESRKKMTETQEKHGKLSETEVGLKL
jgi:hypothetical protein